MPKEGTQHHTVSFKGPWHRIGESLVLKGTASGTVQLCAILIIPSLGFNDLSLKSDFLSSPLACNIPTCFTVPYCQESGSWGLPGAFCWEGRMIAPSHPKSAFWVLPSSWGLITSPEHPQSPKYLAELFPKRWMWGLGKTFRLVLDSFFNPLQVLGGFLEHLLITSHSFPCTLLFRCPWLFCPAFPGSLVSTTFSL